jgi:formiminoglutamase
MIRLGKVKTAFSEIEPLLRDADMISFNLRALKSCDAPAVRNSSPSGFFSEEACQICRYAGLSDKLSSIGFYGYDSEFEIDRDKQTPKTLAQMIWYFIDGYYNRRNDFPVSMDGLMEYIVDFKGHDYQLTFWKSNKTGRWWIQVPVKTKKKLQRHQLIPCSYNDYLLASNEEIPERLINAFKRFD